MPRPGDRDARPHEHFPTRLDRGAAVFFWALAVTTAVVAALMAEPADGFLDGIVPSFLLVAVVWPQLYVFWRLYVRRRREQIAERQERET